MPEPIAVYLHTPFCPTKCGYCDFNSFAMTGAIHERTVLAIIEDVRRSPLRGRPAKTIFFGGGTPTYLEAHQLRRLLDIVREVHPPAEGCEITSEANPGTVDIPKFAAMREMGFNRISMGAQSFLDEDLERLGRVHRSAEIERAFRAVLEAGFENVNLDLMFALPGQTASAWAENLRRAIELGPEHLSLYCLTLEPNTPFYKEHRAGRLVVPDDGEQVAMYDLAVGMAEAAGYRQYEISNFAKPGFECRHNLAYWRYEEYAGYGPGAVGCVDFGFRIADCGLGTAGLTEDQTPPSSWSAAKEGGGKGVEVPETEEVAQTMARGELAGADFSRFGDRNTGPRVRYTNLKHPALYCEAAERSYARNLHPPAPSPYSSHRSEQGEGELRFASQILWCEWEEVDAEKELLERIMLGIRMNDGLPLTSLDLSESEISNLRSQIAGLEERGWVQFSDGVLRLTSEGRHWCSEVALTLI